MNIHQQSAIHPAAELGKNVSVGPFTTIGPQVKIGDNTKIGANVLIEKGTVVGASCQVFHGASLGGPPQILDFQDVSSGLVIGDETVIREYVTIHRSSKENEMTTVGDQCLLMAYVHIAHDCQIGNQVVIVNSTGLSGHVIVEDHAFISGIIGVHQYVRVGRHSMLGGGMVIRRDVLPYSLVTGPPPRLISINSVGLKRRKMDEKIRNSLKTAIKFLLQPDLNTSQAIEKIEAEIEMTEEIRYLINFIKSSSRGITR